MHDQHLIRRTLIALKGCSEGSPTSPCGQCFSALDTLVSSSESLEKDTTQKVLLPYFGVVLINYKNDAVEDSNSQEPAILSSSRQVEPHGEDIFTIADSYDASAGLDIPFEHISLAYYGPWAPGSPMSSLLLAEFESGISYDWISDSCMEVGIHNGIRRLLKNGLRTCFDAPTPSHTLGAIE